MNIFVATKQGQGQRRNDYSHVPDGEWVKFGSTCDRDLRDPDGGCGCGRGMIGVVTGRATTTFAIVDLPVTRAEYREQMRQSSIREGWDKIIGDAEFEAMIDEDVGELLRIAAMFPVGSVLEKRLDQISLRKVLTTVELSPRRAR